MIFLMFSVFENVDSSKNSSKFIVCWRVILEMATPTAKLFLFRNQTIVTMSSPSCPNPSRSPRAKRIKKWTKPQPSRTCWRIEELLSVRLVFRSWNAWVSWFFAEIDFNFLLPTRYRQNRIVIPIQLPCWTWILLFRSFLLTTTIRYFRNSYSPKGVENIAVKS